jgi:hypothetical protein
MMGVVHNLSIGLVHRRYHNLSIRLVNRRYQHKEPIRLYSVSYIYIVFPLNAKSALGFPKTHIQRPKYNTFPERLFSAAV